MIRWPPNPLWPMRDRSVGNLDFGGGGFRRHNWHAIDWPTRFARFYRIHSAPGLCFEFRGRWLLKGPDLDGPRYFAFRCGRR